MRLPGRITTVVTEVALIAAVLSVMAVLTGCGGTPEDTATTEPTATSATSVGPSTSSPPATSQTSATTATSPPSTLVEAGYRATTVITGLRVPWEMRFLPDGRLLITEREGRLVLADVTTGVTTEVGRIDVAARGEAGLMGLALDPAFPETPTLYMTYTYSDGSTDYNRVSRFELIDLPSSSPRLGRETVLVDDISAGPIHDGSRVAFGPNGHLWVTMGDAGDGTRAQRKDSLSGKVLRMTSEGLPSADNPFLDLPYPFSLIYSWGHRNPQGLAFHPQTGAAYITEHGPSDNDEVNRLQPGGNYGWPDLGGKAGRAGFVDPIVAWTPTIAPAGCLFYSGSVLPEMRGAFLFVTLKDSDLRVLVPTDVGDFRAVAEERILFDNRFGRLRAITQGPDGALYIATSNHDGRGRPGPLDDQIIRIDAAH
ncbi:MAG: PQQ-dependent sugar dehydrogenase [Actinobacteria bacterium]|nr:PQQ-dependent sugar dehydrogenase [Actinomycetota bacterium]